MVIASSPALADAREERTLRIDIPAASIAEALAQLSRQAGVSIGAEGALPSRRTRPIHGRMSVERALARLLAGSGYTARQVGATAWRIDKARAAVSGQASAKPSPGAIPEASPGEPIIVTGAKRSVALLDLPIAIAAVDIGGQAAVANPGVLSGTSELASHIEGLTVTALGSGRNRMFLRGVADSPFNGESQSTVAVVLDDARLTFADPDPDIALVDMERVEVLKGPQGSLYGSGALGGIYHLVSRRAEIDETSFEGSAGGEFVAKGGFGYSGSAMANLVLAQDVAAVRLVGYQRQEPGWIDTGDRTDSNSERLSGARAEIGVEPGDGWRLDATGFAQWRDADDSQYVYASGARTRPAQLPEPHDNDLRHLSARLAREGRGTDIVLSSGVTWHEVGDTYDATSGAGSFGLSMPRTLEAERKYRVWDNEVRASGAFGRFAWLAGTSALQARQRAAWTLVGTDDHAVVDSRRRDTTELAVFGDVTVPLWSEISLDAGGRLFHGKVRETQATPEGAGTRNLERTGFTPSLALSWRPDPEQLVFLRYGSAIRQGGLSANASGGPGPVEGDELATLELGWRRDFTGGGRLDLGAYYTTWENLQSDMLQANGLFAARTAGDAVIEGVEGSLEMPLAGDWDLSVGAAAQRTRLVRNDLGIELDDRRLPTIPDFVLRAGLERRFALGDVAASVRLRLRYLGPAHFSFDPQIDRAMGDYLESGIEGRVSLGRFDIIITLDNPLLQDSDRFPFGNPLRFATTEQYTPQRPFNGSVQLHARF